MNSDGFNSRPPIFFRPSPACGPLRGRMPWGSPRPPLMKNCRPPYIRPPYGMTPEALRMPVHMQPPPMFGPRGATIPPHLMGEFKNNDHFQRKESKPQEKKFEFWCDPCERGFNTMELLSDHNREHQKCGIDGCTFTAHMNIVTKHIQMQHSTGLYKKICKTDTPEDINNWINERKKNYPSRANIEKKKAQEQECNDRGEKLKDDKSRFNNKRNNSRNNNQKSYRERSQRNEKFPNGKWKPALQTDLSKSSKNRSNKNTEAKKSTKMDQKSAQPVDNSTEELYCNLKPFKGTSQLIRDDVMCDDTPMSDDNLDIEDDEWKDEDILPDKDQIQNTSAVCKALSNLISAYDSSDNEDPIVEVVDKQSKVYIKKSSEISPSTNCVISESIGSSNINVDDNESGPEEVKIDKCTDHISSLIDIVPSNSDANKESIHKRTRKRKSSNKNEELVAPKVTNASQMAMGDSKRGNNNKIQREQNRRRLPKTLLEKLLEKDIRKERNVILQCVHYVVQNNFFPDK